jgi:hypothetical protein
LTATCAEVRAGRAHALRTLATQLRQRALLPVVLAPVHLHLHLLAGQRPFDEDDLAVGTPADPLPLQIEGFDVQPGVVCVHGPDYPGPWRLTCPA